MSMGAGSSMKGMGGMPGGGMGIQTPATMAPAATPQSAQPLALSGFGQGAANGLFGVAQGYQGGMGALSTGSSISNPSNPSLAQGGQGASMASTPGVGTTGQGGTNLLSLLGLT